VSEHDSPLAEFKLEVEKRFSAIDRKLLLLAVAILSPKLGGPDLSEPVTVALRAIGLPL
jgi:hypothetical protein